MIIPGKWDFIFRQSLRRWNSTKIELGKKNYFLSGASENWLHQLYFHENLSIMESYDTRKGTHLQSFPVLIIINLIFSFWWWKCGVCSVLFWFMLWLTKQRLLDTLDYLLDRTKEQIGKTVLNIACFRDIFATKSVPFITLIPMSMSHVMLFVGVTDKWKLVWKSDTLCGQKIS